MMSLRIAMMKKCLIWNEILGNSGKRNARGIIIKKTILRSQRGKNCTDESVAIFKSIASTSECSLKSVNWLICIVLYRAAMSTSICSAALLTCLVLLLINRSKHICLENCIVILNLAIHVKRFQNSLQIN